MKRHLVKAFSWFSFLLIMSKNVSNAFCVFERKKAKHLKDCLQLKRFLLTGVGDMGFSGSTQVNTVLQERCYRRVSMNFFGEDLGRLHTGVTFPWRMSRSFLSGKGERPSKTRGKSYAKAQKHPQTSQWLFGKHSDCSFFWTQYKKRCLGFRSSQKFYISNNASKIIKSTVSTVVSHSTNIFWAPVTILAYNSCVIQQYIKLTKKSPLKLCLRASECYL